MLSLTIGVGYDAFRTFILVVIDKNSFLDTSTFYKLLVTSKEMFKIVIRKPIQVRLSKKSFCSFMNSKIKYDIVIFDLSRDKDKIDPENHNTISFTRMLNHVQSLSLTQFTRLTKLDLSYNKIGLDGAKELAKVLKLKQFTSLTHINLKSNNIGTDGANSLKEVFELCKNLTYLNLGYNLIGDKIKSIVYIIDLS